jgi:anti-sigma factor RsiW
MPCDKFEDLLAGYSELSAEDRATVDAHLHTCAACREFLETLAALDHSLTTLYRAVEPARAFNPATVRQPSAIPEILDFCGWAAVVAILAFLSIALAARFGITVTIPAYLGWSILAAVAMIALVGQALRPNRAATVRER